jgi:hypothetical protein
MKLSLCHINLLKKSIKKGFLIKKELYNFIVTRKKLSNHNLIPNKPKKVLKNLTQKGATYNIPQKEVEIQDLID